MLMAVVERPKHSRGSRPGAVGLIISFRFLSVFLSVRVLRIDGQCFYPPRYRLVGFVSKEVKECRSTMLVV